MSSQVRGGTRWKRFALVMVPSIAATAAVGVGLAQGALAASFSVSGQSFKVSADKLVGENLIQYGSVAEGSIIGEKDPEKKQKHPVTISGFSKATITNMCQSLVTPVPGLGAITLQLRTGNKGTPAVAENIYLDVAELDADAYFEDLDIGVAVGDGTHTTKPAPGTVADNGLFSQRAKKATLTKVRQKAWATTAGTFTLPDLKLRLLSGDKPCYEDEG
ncbi:DUF6230 family protein [Streptomyces sp. NPDC048606]|uniref:DUF6230 family protein n=1 Tax=Streptomyces sp. NPDC048606 TaxID=3154726 RepID=UPI00341A23F4